jgi:glutathione peroxidase
MRILCTLAVVGLLVAPTTLQAADTKVSPVLNFKMKDINGKEVDLSKYQGKVILLVNVASKCGNTKQYKQLEALHEKFANNGLVVLGVPCNDFGGQEPGTEAEIIKFCTSTYDVKFDMLSKVAVKGDAAAPLYKFLTSKETNPKFAGPIGWNFAKFVIGRNGEVVGRFDPKLSPDAPEVLKLIESELAKK